MQYYHITHNITAIDLDIDTFLNTKLHQLDAKASIIFMQKKGVVIDQDIYAKMAHEVLIHIFLCGNYSIASTYQRSSV